MNNAKIESFLARLLDYGTWVASIIIAIGLGLSLIDSQFGTANLLGMPDMRIVLGGIALFILLPVARVLMMFIFFVREGDYSFSIISLVVLTAILLGLAIGLHVHH